MPAAGSVVHRVRAGTGGRDVQSPLRSRRLLQSPWVDGRGIRRLHAAGCRFGGTEAVARTLTHGRGHGVVARGCPPVDQTGAGAHQNEAEKNQDRHEPPRRAAQGDGRGGAAHGARIAGVGLRSRSLKSLAVEPKGPVGLERVRQGSGDRQLDGVGTQDEGDDDDVLER